METGQLGTQSYQKDEGAQSYLEFINSEDGRIFKQVQGAAILGRLNGRGLKILDAGCGPGWLSKKLAEAGHSVYSCDAAPLLISYAKTNFPEIDFKIADLTKSLPYQD